MPPKSRKQAAFMRGVASGDIKAPGLTRSKALEFVQGVPTKALPLRVKKKK